jgi:hypothetical protein
MDNEAPRVLANNRENRPKLWHAAATTNNPNAATTTPNHPQQTPALLDLFILRDDRGVLRPAD